MEKGLIQSVERAIAILTLLRHSKEALTIADLSTMLEIPRTTLYPIVRTLEKHNLVHRDERNKMLSLGWRVYDLGLGFVNQNADLATKEEARRLRIKWQQTVYSGLYIRNNQVVFTIVELPDTPYILSPRLGFFVNAHCTASGKVLLAYCDKAELGWIFESGELTKQGPNTITDPEQLLSELDNIRKNGYAVDDEESLDGLMCIAVPIFNHLKECIKSLSISGPKEAILSDFEDIKNDLFLSARRLSQIP